MIDEFCSWLVDEYLTGMWSAITTAIRTALAVIVVTVTLPLWLPPFVVWYFTEWRKRGLD